METGCTFLTDATTFPAGPCSEAGVQGYAELGQSQGSAATEAFDIPLHGCVM